MRWYNHHRPHGPLGARTPDEVYGGHVPACERARLELRPRWPRRSMCASPQAPVDATATRAGPPELVVTFVGGRRHLPVVSLRRAATGGQDHFLLPSDDGVLVQVSKATTNCLSSSQRWMLSPAAGSGHRGQSGVELNNDHRRLSTEAETSPKKLRSRLTLEEDCHERSGRHARSIS